MRSWKRPAALLMAAALWVSVLAGCGGRETGGALSVCVGGEPENLDPIYAGAAADQTILTHLYENLMRRSVDVSGESTAVYGVAKSAEQEENPDGTVTWTFQLRSAKWSDGQRVTAGDFVYAWQRLADPANGSPYASVLSIVAGYDAVQETGDASLLQVSAEDDDTLAVVLNGKYDWFLTEVCTATATMPLRQDLLQEETAEEEEPQGSAEEEDAPKAAWWADPETLVTNGPYRVERYAAGDSLVLAASERYHGTGEGPAELTFLFADTAEDAQALYDAGSVDFVGEVPEEQLARLAEADAGALTPELGVYSVLFNCRQELLEDPAIRQALGMVADRSAVAAAAGAAAQPAEGLIPPGVPENGDTDFRTAGGAQLDNETEHYAELCREAERLLTEAGYEDGWGLEEWEYLYVENGRNAAVARILTQTWQDTLHVRITPRGVSEEELEEALKEGTYALAGVEVRPVGNDAECFLMQWGSTSPLNFSGYANSAYDTLLSVIAGAEDEAARMGCLHDAEALLLEDCAVVPLYTDRTAWTLRDGLTGVCRDPRGWFDFTAVAPRSS